MPRIHPRVKHKRRRVHLEHPPIGLTPKNVRPVIAQRPARRPRERVRLRTRSRTQRSTARNDHPRANAPTRKDRRTRRSRDDLDLTLHPHAAHAPLARHIGPVDVHDLQIARLVRRHANKRASRPHGPYVAGAHTTTTITVTAPPVSVRSNASPLAASTTGTTTPMNSSNRRVKSM